MCRALANHARCLVVSVGYRLAPEHTFHATDLSDLPPALIITAEYDPVRDEAEGCADMIHGFFRMFALFVQSHQALAEVADALRMAFAVA